MKAGAPEPALLRSQPQCPPEFAPLIRVIGQFPAPIDWASFEAHARLTGRRYARWELDVLAHVDRKRSTT